MDVTPRELGLAVRGLHWRHHRDGNRILAPLGLTLSQWEVLRNLTVEPDASLHRLAEVTHQSDQAMGELARRMVDRGLLRRESGPGRVVRHYLTDEGIRVYAAAAKSIDGMLAETVGSLTPRERADLKRLLAKAMGES